MGTSIAQMAARAPAATAMAALSMDHLPADRFTLGLGLSGRDFEIIGTVPVIIHDDTEAAAGRLRPLSASFIGPGRSFHAQAFTRIGHEGIIASAGALWRDGKPKEAAAQIPTWLVEQLALIGPPGKIREELPAWRDSLLTTLLVHLPPHPPTLRQVAELLPG